MSKIKLRDKDIKLRGRESLTTKAVRRMNIKALAKNTKPTAQGDQTIEADAVDTGENAAVSSVQWVTTTRKRAAQKKQRKESQKKSHTAKETPEPPPVFSSTSQRDHPEIHIKEQPAPITNNEVHQPIKTVYTHTNKSHTSTKTPSHIGTVENLTPPKILPTEKLEIKNSKAVQPKQMHTTIKNPSSTTPIIHQSSQRIHQTKAAAAQAAAAKKLAKVEKIKDALKSVVQKIGKAIVGKLPLLFGGAAGVLAPILIVILIGALLISPMGIFFSSESESDMTLQEVVGQLNREFSARITERENTIPHDDLGQTGQRAKWKDILSVYAVKVSTDPENPLEVMTMDEERAALLGDIFWDMNSIDYATEIYTEEITVEVPAEDSTDEGGMVEETQTIGRTRLLITISSKTAQQMAEEYNFDQEQLSLMTELLSEEYEELWYGLPYGGGSDDIVAVALSQVGNVGGEPYWNWYGYSSRVAWCACFVSWCGEQCGYIESGAMPKFSYCPTGVQWFKNQGQWVDRSTTPEPGWIVFFDWNHDRISDHVGIVEYSESTVVYTIEGNADDTCAQLTHIVGHSTILGYGTTVE